MHWNTDKTVASGWLKSVRINGETLKCLLLLLKTSKIAFDQSYQFFYQTLAFCLKYPFKLPKKEIWPQVMEAN